METIESAIKSKLRSSWLKVYKNQDLTHDEAFQTMDEIMSGEASEVQMSAYLTAMSMKGETITEITASAEAMRAHCVRLLNDREVLEIVGTGGDGSNTFNISTTSSIVISAAGVPVAKHGNRSASSKCGAADVLEQLGVNIYIEPEKSIKCLEKIGVEVFDISLSALGDYYEFKNKENAKKFLKFINSSEGNKIFAKSADTIRPINNVVDIGNYVMLLTGQPLHMYDADKIASNEFIVKDGFEGDFVALDDSTYKLNKGDLVVTNNNTVSCLAGVMGGLDTEIEDTTKNVVIEAAIFDSVKVRKTSKKIVRSEATKKITNKDTLLKMRDVSDLLRKEKMALFWDHDFMKF